MAQMYGKRRVVLGQKPRYFNKYPICICGSDEASANRPGAKAGHYQRIGFWYKDNGLFYADLRSQESPFVNKRYAGVPTKTALRKFVMNYWTRGDK